MKNKQVPLSESTRDIIFGSLLGDGSLKLHKGYRNARFSFRHSVKQKKYFFWKAEQLKEITSNKSVFPQKADGFSKVEKLRFQSKAMEVLTELYELTHKKNRFSIRRKWLNMMNSLALAIWWCDDGSLIANTRKGVFCTDGFDKHSVQILAKYLQKVWNIKVHVAPIGRTREGRQEQYWRIWIRSTTELKKFLRIILPYIPQSMIYKCLILYKDLQLQQRWISEIVNLTNFSEQEVLKLIEKRKSQLKFFRK